MLICMQCGDQCAMMTGDPEYNQPDQASSCCGSEIKEFYKDDEWEIFVRNGMQIDAEGIYYPAPYYAFVRLGLKSKDFTYIGNGSWSITIGDITTTVRLRS